MAREIHGTLYRIKSYSGVPHYVECQNEYDLHCYIVEHWIMKGYPFSSVNEICTDGTTPKVTVLSNKKFQQLLSKYKNFNYAVEKLIDNGYYIRFSELVNHADVYYKDRSGDFTSLCPCDDTRRGYVCIEGKTQNIDKWLEGRFL